VVKATRLGAITPEKSRSSRLGVCLEASSLTQENYLLKKLNEDTPDKKATTYKKDKI
jgi:hypothetical protein